MRGLAIRPKPAMTLRRRASGQSIDAGGRARDLICGSTQIRNGTERQAFTAPSPTPWACPDGPRRRRERIRMTPARFKEARQLVGRPGLKISEWSCKICLRAYAVGQFYVWENGRPASYCKTCWNKRSSSKGRDRSDYRSSPRGKAQDMIATARRRATERKITFTITIDWLEEKLLSGKCEITGLHFYFGRGRTALSPSLDQTIPGDGYTAGNTKVVCWVYNRAKGDGTHADVLLLARSLFP